MHYSFSVQEPYRSLILSGQKTIEGRLKKGKFASLQVGDFLELEESGAIFEVKRLASYPSFYAMLRTEGLEKVLPNIADLEQGEAVYYQFFSPEQEKEFGVLAIEVKSMRTKRSKNHMK